MPATTITAAGFGEYETDTLCALIHTYFASGIRPEVVAGVSDEGDPWVAIIEPDTEITILHVCREGATYGVFGVHGSGRSDCLLTLLSDTTGYRPKTDGGLYEAVRARTIAVLVGEGYGGG